MAGHDRAVGEPGGVRYEGGADTVTGADRRQTCHVGAHRRGDGGGLRLAQLRELGCRVRDRTVMLADLDPAGHGGGGGSEAILGEHLGDCLRPVRWARWGVGRCPNPRRDTVAESCHPRRGELAHCRSTVPIGEVVQYLPGEVVVSLIEAVTTGGSQREHPRRSAAAPGSADRRPVGRGGIRPDPTTIHEGVELLADGRRRQPKALSKGCGRCRPLVEEHASHALVGGFHNHSVA